MSSTQQSKHQGESEIENGGSSDVRPAVNPLVAAAVGAVFLASDPGVSLATQSVRDALLSEQQSSGVRGGIFLAASGVKANTDLKDLLGEVHFFLCLGRTILGVFLGGWRCVELVL